MFPVQTVLHPTDFSERSDHAFRVACSLARDHGAQLVVLHVVPHPEPLTYGEILELTPPLSPDYRRELETKLERYRKEDANIAVACHLVQGFAADEIIRAAHRVKADLVVMGTHGRTGFGRLLMGSVAEQVVRKAECPVLTVKGPATAKDAPKEAVPESAGLVTA